MPLTEAEMAMARRMGLERLVLEGHDAYIGLVRRRLAEANTGTGLAAARAYQAEQDRLWAAVLACPAREVLPALLPGEVRSCGCRARCKAGKGGAGGMVGDHICIECQRQRETIAW